MIPGTGFSLKNGAQLGREVRFFAKKKCIRVLTIGDYKTIYLVKYLNFFQFFIKKLLKNLILFVDSVVNNVFSF